MNENDPIIDSGLALNPDINEESLPGYDLLFSNEAISKEEMNKKIEELSDEEEAALSSIHNAISTKAPSETFMYLVRGAKLKCTMGSHMRHMNLPTCHGTYISVNPMVFKYDCTHGEGENIPLFGVCMGPGHPGGPKILLISEDKVDEKGKPKNVKGYPCLAPLIGTWMNYHSETLIALNDGNAKSMDVYDRTYTQALTMDSFMVCPFGGLVEPKTSGQENVPENSQNVVSVTE